MANKRSIFEDVSDTSRQEVATGVIDKGRHGARRGVRIWLQLLFLMVLVLIVVGGLTRLTDSGLSITEWRPFSGAIPPLTPEDWEREFALYQQIDEFRLQNDWMQLSDFKFIYWWEWGHRQLARAIGVVWAVGFLGFLALRRIPTGWTGKLLLLGVLGGLQGAIGWWMVSSGVTQGEGMLDVASYRLATHLGLAFIIMGLISWYIFQLGREERDLMQARRQKERAAYGMSTGLLHFAFLQILIGALVAGIDAGRSCLDWPRICGEWAPSTPFLIEPAWRNFFENPVLVQFIHRVTGYTLFVFGVVVWLVGRRSVHPKTRLAFNGMMAVLLVQVVVGVVTVLYGAPWYIAIVHQFLAVVLWVLILRARFLSRYPITSSIRGA